MDTRRRVGWMLAAATALALSAAAGPAAAQMTGGPYGPMMGPNGMMGQQGMMGGAYGPAPQGGPAGFELDPRAADALVGYVRDQRLACLQCHGVDAGNFAPPFAQIAQVYEQRADAPQALQASIVRGIGRMPGGLATPEQAARLSQMILDLGKPAK